MLGMRGEPPELEYKAEFSALVAMGIERQTEKYFTLEGGSMMCYWIASVMRYIYMLGA